VCSTADSSARRTAKHTLKTFSDGDMIVRK
jgi:hypothetical protein